MKIQILIDNPDSWFMPYGVELNNTLTNNGHNSKLIHSHKDVEKGDVLFLLSCEKIFKALDLNKHNIVVHESELPKGRGMSPLTWQILEGKNRIPITLFEATEKMDDGDIYLQKYIEFDGTELNSELKHQQGLVTISLALEFINNIDNITARSQIGTESVYPRRSSLDSRLDIHKSIEEQFDLLRVCDNERYPAFFEINGVKYILKIYKA